MNLLLAILSALLLAAILSACRMRHRGLRLAAIAVSSMALVSIVMMFVFAERSAPPSAQPNADPQGGAASPVNAAPVAVPQSILDGHTPQQVAADGYVSSNSCRQCHPAQYDAWHASFHRTMTQRATPTAVVGDFNNAHVKFADVEYRLQRRGDQFWCTMTMEGPATGRSPPIELPLVLTTGSHHMQIYWFPVRNGRTLGQLPLAYLIEEQKWVPMDSSFLKPPPEAGAPPSVGRWNNECIQCHTTHGRTRPVAGAAYLADSQVAEFGIACEACHGPAEKHVQLHRAAETNLPNGSTKDPIVNPSSLPHDRSAEVCGRCHGVTVPRKQAGYAELFADGYQFRPGDRLADTLHLVSRNDATRARLKDGLADSDDVVDRELDSRFWSDGMVRVSGREFNGLADSACYQQGQMSCLSCHQMHQAEDDPRPLQDWTDDQLRPSAMSDDACLQCHQSDDYANAAHTRHLQHSHGSRCYNCHMPHTTYGLLKAIRSHTIDSPSAASSLASGRPNACNLCHLDKTLAWTAERLQDWYSIEAPEFDETTSKVSAAVLWGLRGDAGQRALVAWHMGWSPAVEASGGEWMPPYLATLLDDPYDAVRFIAHRSLQRLPQFENFQYDFVAPPASRLTAVERAMKQWNATKPNGGFPDRDAVLIGSDGKLMQKTFSELQRQRDDRPVDLVE